MEIYAKDIDVEKELLTNKSFKREDLTTIREWIEENYSYSLKPSDLQLFLFLHSCYYDIELAKKTAITFYQMRADWPEVMKNRNPTRSPLKEQLEVGVIWKLQSMSEQGYHVIYAKLIDFDSNNYDFEVQCKMCIAIMDYWLNKAGNSKGIISLLDATGITWGHLPKFNLYTIRKLLNYLQDAAPIRLKGIHVMNSNTIMEKLFNMCKLMMRQDLIDMIHLHSTLDTLEKYVRKRSLPSEYNGDDVSAKKLQEQMQAALLENVDFFAKDDQEDIKEPTSRFTYLNID